MADMVAPFKVIGPCVAITGSFTGQTASGTLIGQSGDWTLHAFNRASAQDAYLAFGPNSTAVTSAVVPVIGAPPAPTGLVLPVPRLTVQTFTFSGPTYFACIVAAGNATLDLTPGTGT